MPAAPKPLDSYDDVKALLNAFLAAAHVTIAGKHKVFWNTMNYAQFRDGDVPNVVDPSTFTPMKILLVGKPEESNLILALKGVGPLFDDDTGTIGRMPKNGPPWMPDDQIAALADWIKMGCPDPSNPPGHP